MSAVYALYYSNVTVSFSDIMGGYTGIGNIDAEPLFVDAGNGGVHLQVGSPCIDTATALGAPERDFDVEARPVGDGIDMGADEFYAGPETAITAPIDGQVFNSDLIDVIGTVNTDDLFVTVNGGIAVVENHQFTLENFLLSPGPNVIAALAEDTFQAFSTGARERAAWAYNREELYETLSDDLRAGFENSLGAEEPGLAAEAIRAFVKKTGPPGSKGRVE